MSFPSLCTSAFGEEEGRNGVRREGMEYGRGCEINAMSKCPAVIFACSHLKNLVLNSRVLLEAPKKTADAGENSVSSPCEVWRSSGYITLR